jgi:peptidoglycan/LPS O-acetylase OafA/YrhL
MGKISYSVFLIHFPVCLLVNAAFTRFVEPEPELQAFGMLVAWGFSLAAGAAFHRWVEEPLGRLMHAITEQVVVRDVHVPRPAAGPQLRRFAALGPLLKLVAAIGAGTHQADCLGREGDVLRHVLLAVDDEMHLLFAGVDQQVDAVV